MPGGSLPYSNYGFSQEKTPAPFNKYNSNNASKMDKYGVENKNSNSGTRLNENNNVNSSLNMKDEFFDKMMKNNSGLGASASG
jgi:hypothetical protein